jgi:hypothetical protein
MRRLCMLFMLLVAVCAGQIPGPAGTNRLPNGLWWRSMSLIQQQAFVMGGSIWCRSSHSFSISRHPSLVPGSCSHG